MTWRGFGFGIVAIGVMLGLWWWRGSGGTGERKQAAGPVAAARVEARRPVAPASDAAIEVRVRGVAGLPAVGAIVRAHARLGRRDLPPVATGTDGRASLAVAPGSYRVTAAASGGAPASAIVDVAADQRVAVELVLGPPAPTIHGAVSDASGGPVAGAVVRVATRPGMLIADVERAVAAITDASGRFAIALPIGRYQLDTRHPEYRGDTRAIDLGPGGVEVAIQLTPGSAIEGSVVDRTAGSGADRGAPVGGATVRWERELARERGFRSRAERGEVTAEADGSFRITGLGPGRITLHGDAGDGRRSPELVELELGIAETLTDVVVPVVDLPAIPVRVVRADGTPAAGATVTATGDGGSATAVTGDDGRARLAVVRRGRFDVVADADDTLPSAVVATEVGEAPPAEVALKLVDGAYVTGRVEPAVAADIDLQPDPLPEQTDRIVPRAVRSEDDGRFRLGPYAPGGYRIRARAADGRTAERTVALPASGLGDVVLALEARGTITGRVVDRGGTPQASAVVLVRPREIREIVTIADGVDSATARVPADADGRFAITGRAPGTWELIAVDARGAGMHFADQQPTHDVELAAGATVDVELVVEPSRGAIRGVVLDGDDRPVADAWVTITSRDLDTIFGMAPGTARLPVMRGGGPKQFRNAVLASTEQPGDAAMSAGEIPTQLTGADGRFAVTGLRAGTYRVTAEARRGGARGSTDPVGVESGPIDVVLKLARLGSITGVVRAGGAPAADFDVVARADGQGLGRAPKSRSFHTAAGRFELRGLDPATYHLRVHTATASWEGSAVVTAGAATEVAVDAVADARITGRIADAHGAPLQRRVNVVERRDTPMGRHSARSAADGRFSIALPPGFRQVIVLGEGDFGHEVTLDIELAPGQVLDLGTLVPVPQ